MTASRALQRKPKGLGTLGKSKDSSDSHIESPGKRFRKQYLQCFYLFRRAYLGHLGHLSHREVIELEY